MNLQNKNSMVLEQLSFFMLILFCSFSLDIGTDAAFCYSRGLLLPSCVLLLKNFNTHTQTLMKFKGPVELANTLYT
jgi:hypothetical protein